jgi:hypothetical protein
MLSFAKTFFTGGSGVMTYVVAGMGVVLLATFGLLYFTYSELEDANKELGAKGQQITQLQETAEHNAEMYRRAGQQHTRDLAAISKELDIERRRKNRERIILKEVIREKPEDKLPEGCPDVPPMFLRALDGLRELRNPEAGHKD